MHNGAKQLTEHRHAAIFVCFRLILYYIVCDSSILMSAWSTCCPEDQRYRRYRRQLLAST